MCVSILYVPVNNFSAMSGRGFLGWTSTKQRIKGLAQGYNAVPQPATLRSHSASTLGSIHIDIVNKIIAWLANFDVCFVAKSILLKNSFRNTIKACLKINVRNYGDVINAFMQMIIKRAYLQKA